MTTLTVAPAWFDAVGSEPTLDQLLAGAWEALSARGAVECPVCPGEMAREYGARALPIGGHCGACGSGLT